MLGHFSIRRHACCSTKSRYEFKKNLENGKDDNDEIATSLWVHHLHDSVSDEEGRFGGDDFCEGIRVGVVAIPACGVK